MLATLVVEPFDDKEWIFETKWDGFRLVTEKRGHNVRLWSRNGVNVSGHSFQTSFPGHFPVWGDIPARLPDICFAADSGL